MMSTWTLQIGYPLITFRKLESAQGEKQIWCISQSRFLSSSMLNGTDKMSPPSKYNYTWFVPVQFKTDVSPVESIMLNATKNSSNAHVELPPKARWIKANMHGSGFYRVQYPQEIWQQLILQLKEDHSALSPADRAQLLDDAFSLCRAGFLNASVPMEMIMYLVKEDSFIVWTTALSHLAIWKNLLQETPARELMNEFILSLLDPLYRKLKWEDKGDHIERLLRQKILRAAIDYGHKDVTYLAKEEFRTHLVNKTHISPNLQELVYSVGIRTGSKEDWVWCYETYKNSNIPSERSQLLISLGDSQDVFVIQGYLDMTLNKTHIRGQDVQTVLQSVASNPSGTFLAWRHLQRHWNIFHDMFQSGSFTMGHIIKSVTKHFSTDFEYQQVQNFFSTRDVGAGKLALRQSLEEIKLNIEFRRKYEDEIFAWLQARKEI